MTTPARRDRLAGTASAGTGVRVLALLVAVALGGAAVVGGTEAVLAELGRRPWLVDRSSVRHTLMTTDYGSTGVRVVCGAVLALGLVLLLLAVRRGTPPALALTAQAGGVVVTVERTAFTRTLRDRLERVDGVRSASVALGRRRAVRARLAVTPGMDLARAREAGASEIDAYERSLGVVRPGRVRVTASETKQ